MFKNTFLINILFVVLFVNTSDSVLAQLSTKPAKYVSKVWVADNGDGTYKNPIINADYSDPDAIRVGDWFRVEPLLN